jgi:hypothetical protein
MAQILRRGVNVYLPTAFSIFTDHREISNDRPSPGSPLILTGLFTLSVDSLASFAVA